MRAPVVLVTGAGGEIGHALIASLAADGTGIITLDLNPLDPSLAGLVRREFVGSIADANLLDRILAEFEIEHVYHLAEQREMMGTFLDQLGLKHENGLIEEDDAKPDPEKIGPAVDAIAAKYPADDVSLYLTTLVCQDPETWGGLSHLPQLMP